MNRYRRKGFALILAIGYAGLVGLMAGGYVASLNQTHRALREAEMHRSCIVLAESGIEKALVLLRTDRGYRGEQDTPLGEGRFSVEVAPEGAAYRITSTGALLDDTGVDPFIRKRVVRTVVVRLGANGRVASLRFEESRS